MSAKSFKVCWHEPKNFFGAVNRLLSKCTSTINDTILLHLRNTCTMRKSVLLYASECVCNSRSDVVHVTKKHGISYFINCLESANRTVLMIYRCILELNL